MKAIRHIKRFVQNTRRRLRPKAAILMYHRILDLPVDPYNLAVSPDNFAQQMEFVKRFYQPISLLELAEAVKTNSVPRNSIVITFDDGYFDSYSHAYPILEALQIPWTLFVASDLIGSANNAWWDELDHAMLQTPNVPEHLELNIQGQLREWTMTTAQERLDAYFYVHRLLLPLPSVERKKVINHLFQWAGLKRKQRSKYRMMTVSELEEVARSEFVDLGGHTKSHPYLSSLPVEEQFKEIAGGQEALQNKTSDSISMSTFSYPYGNYTDETVEMVQEAGFEAAVTVHATKVHTDSDLFQLGRYHAKNWHIDEFREKLSAIFRQ